jgi:hypothetical protein
MSDLAQSQKDLLRLIVRSPDIGEGWRVVSDTLWPVILTELQGPDLIEINQETRRIRLTQEGVTVVKYVL